MSKPFSERIHLWYPQDFASDPLEAREFPDPTAVLRQLVDLCTLETVMVLLSEVCRQHATDIEVIQGNPANLASDRECWKDAAERLYQVS